MYEGVESLTSKILLYAIAVQKLICTSILFKNLIKTAFLIRYQLFPICFLRVLIVIGYFLFKEQALIGLWKVIGIQNWKYFLDTFWSCGELEYFWGIWPPLLITRLYDNLILCVSFQLIEQELSLVGQLLTARPLVTWL